MSTKKTCLNDYYDCFRRDENVMSALVTAMKAYISKPIDQDEMEKTMKRLRLI